MTSTREDRRVLQERTMKTIIAAVAIGIFGLQAAARGGADTGPERPKNALIGTWKHIDANIQEGVVHIKHVTPTHWTWVVYDVKAMDAVAVAGGTWSLEGDQYKERVEFASETHPHLRGKEYSFTSKVDDGRWTIKVSTDADIVADEVWERMKGKL
jgi:hypothetical protein